MKLLPQNTHAACLSFRCTCRAPASANSAAGDYASRGHDYFSRSKIQGHGFRTTASSAASWSVKTALKAISKQPGASGSLQQQLLVLMCPLSVCCVPAVAWDLSSAHGLCYLVSSPCTSQHDPGIMHVILALLSGACSPAKQHRLPKQQAALGVSLVIVPSGSSTHAVVCVAAATQQNASVPGLTVLDMGQHMLPKVAGAHLIVQVLVPGLEERAHAMPPLSSVAMSPGER